MIGFYAAIRKDDGILEAQKTKLEELMEKHIRNADGRLSTENALAISPLVAYCQVVRTKKKGYINLLMRTGPGLEIMEILATTLDRVGKRQTDPSVPKPIFKEIKDALVQARGKGKGGGKGSGARG